MYDLSKLTQLRDLVDNDEAELLSLVEEYETNSEKLISQMREALSQGSAKEVSRGAHTLKSSSALMGASGLASRCEELETMTRHGQLPSDTAERLATLETGFQDARAWLRQQIRG